MSITGIRHLLEKIRMRTLNTFANASGTMSAKSDSKQKRSTEGCSKFRSPETRQVQERLVSTLEHMQVPKWDRTR